MTKTKKEIIEQINRLSGQDRTDELNELTKYKLCAIVEDLKENLSDSSSGPDLSKRIGVSVKFSNTNSKR